MKNAPPTIPVKTPIGVLSGAITVGETMSASTKNNDSSNALAGKMRRLSAPRDQASHVRRHQSYEADHAGGRDHDAGHQRAHDHVGEPRAANRDPERGCGLVAHSERVEISSLEAEPAQTAKQREQGYGDHCPVGGAKAAAHPEHHVCCGAGPRTGSACWRGPSRQTRPRPRSTPSDRPSQRPRPARPRDVTKDSPLTVAWAAAA